MTEPKSKSQPLLVVKNLRTYFKTDDGLAKAVDGQSFCIYPGETFALVGESGCGKSVTSFSIMGLVPQPPGEIVGGEIKLDGKELLTLSEREMRKVRGGRISMIFQEPMTSLNPVFTCGNQIVEAIRLHRKLSKAEAKALAIDMLDKVGIVNPAQRYHSFPHQLSGGMRQRVMIAMALSCDPELLIADEPTTALDVTIQAQILDLLTELQSGSDLGMLLITHDLAVVAEVAHRVAVMYASKIVEHADVNTLFAKPQHPYTRGLLRSIPKLGERSTKLETIPGNVPNPLNFPTGCKFHPRCELGCNKERCQAQEPPLKEIRPGHWVRCWEVDGFESAPETCLSQAKPAHIAPAE
ncbi:MAG: ABC transporter ATP-binding protein [Phycisphaerales bacterium]|jgi:oligopeptide/dipeptide ABC transporter ATP-binding protein|nr:ABC transporter ATP-binding protein [Phycisphaerales bacterium]